MDKRIRSPNYPAIGLREAVEKAAALYKSIHTHAAPREVVAKGMGYTSLNGASATVISALHKYGLLEREGEGIRVSDRAMCILHPQSPEERAEALRDAAISPPLFAELNEKFPGTIPNDDLLRNYLIRKGFAPGAVSSVILSYRETSELVGHEGGGYNSPVSSPTGASAMQPEIAYQPPGAGANQPRIVVKNEGDERSIARYDFEGGGHIRIMVGGTVETDEALSMAETLIGLKRHELARRKTAKPDKANDPDDSEENETE